MIILQAKKLEKLLGKELLRNTTSFGVDTASRTGWCRIDVSRTKLTIDYGFLDIKGTDLFFKYDRMIEAFHSMIGNLPNNTTVVIEDTFFGRNVKTLKMLSRIGMIVYICAKEYQLYRYFVLASSARSRLGFKGTSKKVEVHKQILKRLKLDLKDEDVIDAFVLALNGILKDEDNPSGQT